MHGRHTKMRPHHWAAIIGAVAVTVSLAVVIAWFDRTHDEGTSPTTSSRTAGSPSAADVARRLHACEAVWRAQSGTLDAAGRSLEQWQVHVDAMNQLVAGQITLAQAMDFWNRTRQGAAARVARFQSADGTYADVAPRCAGLSAGAATSRELTACRAGVRARDRAIEAGAVAVTTWKHHIMDMEMLRAGQITPQQATQMWLKNWRLGVRQLDAFSQVRARAAHAGSCVVE